MPRDEDPLMSASPPSSKNMTELDRRSLRRLHGLVEDLQTLGSLLLLKTKNAFQTERRGEVDFPAAILQGCTDDFDGELFEGQVQDFFALAKRQVALVKASDLEALEASIRNAEMEMSIAAASDESLGMVRQRLELIATDRQKRFDVLKQIVEEVCLREMNLYVDLKEPDKGQTLLLQPTSALGLFGLALKKAGESLPIG